MMARILVDTSVFVDFLRGRDVPLFKELLLDGRILLSRYVKLELMQGARKEDAARLDYVLGGIDSIPHLGGLMDDAERLLRHAKGKGMYLGIVDLIIAAESLAMKAPIYSFDKVFKKLADANLIRLFEA